MRRNIILTIFLILFLVFIGIYMPTISQIFIKEFFSDGSIISKEDVDNQKETYIQKSNNQPNITTTIKTGNKKISKNDTNIVKNDTNIVKNDTNIVKNDTNKYDIDKNDIIKNIDTYNRQENDGIITYKFNSGEILELKVSGNNVEINDSIYRTNVTGNHIIFVGDIYEKLVPDRITFLAPITNSITNKTLKVNETLKLKDNYSFVVYDINDREFKSRILKNNNVIRDYIINRNAPILSIGVWKEINEFKKERVLYITPVKINHKDIVINVNQYGSKKTIALGNKYGEFQIINITDDSIIMKNFKPIKVETGKETSLMNNKIKIKI